MEDFYGLLRSFEGFQVFIFFLVFSGMGAITFVFSAKIEYLFIEICQQSLSIGLISIISLIILTFTIFFSTIKINILSYG